MITSKKKRKQGPVKLKLGEDLSIIKRILREIKIDKILRMPA